MKIYDIFDSGWLAVYQERAQVIYISGFRKETRNVLVEKTGMKEIEVSVFKAGLWILVPGRWEEKMFWVPEEKITKTRTVPGHWETETRYIEGHYETKEIWIPEHEEKNFVEVPGYIEQRMVQDPGYWERQNIWVPEYYVTRYYWREAHPARGLEAAWIPYQHIIEAGYKEQRVWVVPEAHMEDYWVDGYWEYQTVVVPGQFRDHRVWIDGNFEDVPFWVGEQEEKYQVVVAGHQEKRRVWVEAYDKFTPAYRTLEKKMVEATWEELEEVEVDVPIYSYYYPDYEYEVISIQKGPEVVMIGEPEGDKLIMKTPVSKIEVEMEGYFLGNAVRIGDNQYVLPSEELD